MSDNLKVKMHLSGGRVITLEVLEGEEYLAALTDADAPWIGTTMVDAVRMLRESEAV